MICLMGIIAVGIYTLIWEVFPIKERLAALEAVIPKINYEDYNNTHTEVAKLISDIRRQFITSDVK